MPLTATVKGVTTRKGTDDVELICTGYVYHVQTAIGCLTVGQEVAVEATSWSDSFVTGLQSVPTGLRLAS